VLVALLLGLLLCSVIAVVSVTLGSGSSLRGGVGQSSFAPTAVSDVHKQYRLGAGELDINLSAVTFPARATTVYVTVGLGQLSVQVPANAAVTVDAHAGMGEVDVFDKSGREVQGKWPPGTRGAKSTPHLTLDVHVGVGEIQVTRG
jgi:predicted membrane protein